MERTWYQHKVAGEFNTGMYMWNALGKVAVCTWRDGGNEETLAQFTPDKAAEIAKGLLFLAAKAETQAAKIDTRYWQDDWF